MPVEASRRAVFTSALAGAAAIGVATQRTADAARPLPISGDPALHAARRLSYGATPALVAQIRSRGLAGWVDDQLSVLPDVKGAVAGPLAALPAPELALNQLPMAGRDVLRDLKTATFARAVWGEHQLYELLVEFWTNHLSITGDLPGMGASKVVDDRDVIRAHALGTYTDMLLASSHSPAMLRYLGNAVSHGNNPNENYARELLELHTVGVRSRYRPSDVRNAAIVLTGLGVEDGTKLFTYRAAWHGTGRVRVLGWSHPNNDASKGQEVAASLVRYLAAHPSTAHRIATKLVRRFVGDPVPKGLVASAAKVYLSSGTAIVPVVRHILLSKDFARSAGRKTQRPYEWFAASARALGLQQDPIQLNAGFVTHLQRLAQSPFEWPQPDGYPDVTSAWASTSSLLARWNLAQALVRNQVPGFLPLDVPALIGTPVPTTAGALVDRLIRRILLVPPRPALRSALLGSIGMKSTKPITAATAQALTPELAALIISSPEAQVR
jgi:hypothetical protein